MRVTQERGQDRRHYATGDCLTLRAGRRVELSGDAVHDATGEVFACLGARHAYVSNNYATGSKATEETGYKGEYILMPETAPLAPRRKTELARVPGPQTARVVGEGEIDCDEYGRILVRFHWDLDDAYSMRCRVSQNWSGNGWGGMVIPRIGMEVLVEFLDGDPDKPLVTGCVYNGRNKVPYDLPSNKTRSTFKTDTHRGKGYNEVRFEDKNGQEEIFIHAEKDWNEKTLHNHTARIDNNQVLSVGHVFSQEVEYSKQTFVGGNYNVRIGAQESDGPIPNGQRKQDQGIGRYGYLLGEKGNRPKPKGNYSLRTEGNQFFQAEKNIVIATEQSMTISSDEDMAITFRTDWKFQPVTHFPKLLAEVSSCEQQTGFNWYAEKAASR